MAGFGEASARGMARLAARLSCAGLPLVVAFCLATVTSSAAATAPPPPGGAPEKLEVRDRIPGAYIVVLKNSVDHPGNVAETQTDQRGGDLGFVYRSALKGYSVKDLSKADVEALRSDPRVQSVHPDTLVEALAQTIPSGVDRIFAPQNEALDIDESDDVRVDADVAVIDSGIDIEHPDLNVFARTNCVPADEFSEFQGCVDNTGAPGNSHGTHVAGTVGALDNGFGTVGVAPGARLWSVRVLGNNNIGYGSWIIGGIDWVASHAGEIEVANMSIGGEKTVGVEQAITKSMEKGVVYAIAAGNSQRDALLGFPSIPNVIGVSGLADYDGKPGGEGSPTCGNQGVDDQPYRFSNWGSVITIAAPATCVYSTVKGGGYEAFSGTSMASPHVAGAAAVRASESNPNSLEDVKQIRQTLLDEGSLDWTDTTEDGKVEPLLYLGGTPLTKTEVATGAPRKIDGENVTLTGAINPRGLATEYKFEYGSSEEYGQSFPLPMKKLAVGTKYTAVSETIGGLKPDQTYHYRLVATNSSGTVYGEDKTFIPSRWRTRLSSEPTSPSEGWLGDVSCPTKNSCLAVGRYSPTTGRAVSYEGAGNDWQLRSVPWPAEGTVESLQGVSCTSASACTAVGDGSGGGNIVPRAVRWNGSEWALQEISPPAGFQEVAKLSDVSCSSASDCMAVGWYRNSEGYGRNYSTRWNGSTWSTVSTPNPESLEKSVLESVSCSKPEFCTAVGWYNPLVGMAKKVVMTWNGSSWKEGAAASSAGSLRHVDCTSSTHCISIAASEIEAWDGSTWSSQAPATPSDATGIELEGVSCASPSYCVAAGQAVSKSNGTRLTLAEAWNGISWTVQSTARESQSNISVLGGSDCVAPARCVAVGWNFVTGRQQPLVETLTAAPIYQLSFGAKGSGNGQLQRPLGMAVDAEGNVFVADSGNNRIQKFNSKGEYISQFGTSGSGNGQLQGPSDVAIDANGDLWVVDRGNDRIQKFNSKGEYLSQFGSAGTGNGQFEAPTGIAIAPNGHIWVTDFLFYRVSEFTASGEFIRRVGAAGNGPGQFEAPQGIDVDAEGNVWVADRPSNRIQKLSSTGEYLDEFGAGGNEEGEFEGPTVLDVLPSGELLIADRWTGRVQMFSPTGRYQTQLGGGPLSEPEGMGVGADGAIYVASSAGNVIKKWVEPATPSVGSEAVTEVGEEGVTLNAMVNPNGSGTTYQFEYGATTNYGSKVPAAHKGIGSSFESVKASETIQGLKRATTYHYRIVASNEMGTTTGEDKIFTTTAATPIHQFSFGAKGSGNGKFSRPKGMAVDAEGNVFVADSANNRIQKFNSKGEYLSQFGTSGSGNGQLKTPSDVAIDSAGDLWIADSGNFRLQKFNSKGEYISQFGVYGSGSGQFKNPSSVAIAPNGHIWVTDYQTNRLNEFTASGEFIQHIFGFGGFIQGVAIDPTGNVWVADRGGHRVKKFSSTGELILQFGSEGEGNGQFRNPTVIDVLPSGAILVTDRWTGRVQEFSSEGQYITQFGKGQLTEPEGIAVDPNGAIYVSNSAGNTVRKWIEPLRPVVGAEVAKEVGEKNATLTATVNPHGLSTTYQFEYGTTTSYGLKVPLTAKGIGSGGDGVKVSETIEGLTGGTTYHFRITASNEMGITKGSDQVFTTTAKTPTLKLSFGSGGSGNGQFNRPKGIAVDAAGNVFVADSGNNRIQKFNSQGEYLSQFGTSGSGNGQLKEPSDVAIDGAGDLWIADSGNFRLQKFNSKGEYLAQFGSFGSGNGQFKNPSSVAIAPNGHIWVADFQTSRVSEFTAAGEFIRNVVGFGGFLQGIAVDAANHVWVADRAAAKVQELSPTGEFLSQFGSVGEGNGQFMSLTVLDVMPSGSLLVTDRWTGRVQMFSTGGVYLTQFGKGQHTEPEGIAVGSDGAIYVASSYNQSVKKWAP